MSEKISDLLAGGAIQATDLFVIARGVNNYRILGNAMWSLDTGTMTPVVPGSGLMLVDSDTGNNVSLTCNNTGIDYYKLAPSAIDATLALQGNTSGDGGSVVLNGGTAGGGDDNGILYCNTSPVVKWTHLTGSDATLLVQDNETDLQLYAFNGDNTASLSLGSSNGVVSIEGLTSPTPITLSGTALDAAITCTNNSNYLFLAGGTNQVDGATILLYGTGSFGLGHGSLGAQGADVLTWQSNTGANSYFAINNGTNSGLSAPTIAVNSSQTDCDLVLLPKGTGTVIINGNFTVNDSITFANLPTSATGLSSGAIWNNSGVLNIVP